MKVQTRDDNLIDAIGKKLENYNAIDTGIFLCPETVFDYLRRALNGGDCSLADGVRLMAAEGKALAIDIGEAWWQDVDTPEMLAQAENKRRVFPGRDAFPMRPMLLRTRDLRMVGRLGEPSLPRGMTLGL